ncbi:peptidase domain-containing ABC transporter [Rhizobium sp. TRM96647]|uniref:peptidase domain-containing ABC transporter n=1 Tax=unclassified Rhizobium TaxID=2613769 RepID=UPI0021E88D0F|nr:MULTISPECIES: peptidase domain-containing ABC transporter [unclassified Rhizobium]MCV3737957.1 peptidase domain-containing ABC transporter [Rhizobium sp. TRM96647]MCV3759644.1 peptidase domain-containing ABC transporter [Rhizobium sp. TRM96650]
MTKNPHTNLQCLVLVARHHGVDLSPERLMHDYAVGDAPVTRRQMLRMAKDAGLRARHVTLDWDGLFGLGEAFPVIAELENGNWVLIAGAGGEGDNRMIRVLDPLAERPEFMLLEKKRFLRSWHGSVILAKRSYRMSEVDQPFGFRWFIPEIIRQRSLFRDVALAALVLYGLGLATPIFFQLVIDKVLVHQSYATLTVLTIGIAIALVFDAAFTFLRRYLLLYATNKIDIKIATRTFGHLLNLPVALFEQTSAGVLVKHMQQTGRIREFLTGRLFLTLLDGLSLFVFVPILFLYSVKLTLVVLAFAGLVGLVVMLLVGPFNRRLQALYQAEGERQALLVETVHGMRTVKSLALEPRQRKVWDDSSAQSISVRFRVDQISAIAQSLIGLVEKLMSVAIIGLGALDVFGGAMTIGALVAFNMLAGRVSGPLVQIVTMVHEYQEVALSVRMLGEIMNQRPEQYGRGRGMRPELHGRIEFDNVTFRYGPDGPPALDAVSFTVPAGSVFGIVGKSGSGKTTVTRLIQGLYQNQQGIVRIDGYDSREIDLVHLRTSIGVVLQDNFLFRGTVRDNIAAARPDASIEEIVEVAHMAGAEEFIERLPRGFETMLEENGSNLSGGQKQRLAIARALLTNPKLLIFDEATSALDPDSEAIIRQNLSRIAAGRTVIIVSHRLSTLVDADAILVVDRGKVADIGRHDQLVSRCMTYRHLWSQQTRQVA